MRVVLDFLDVHDFLAFRTENTLKLKREKSLLKLLLVLAGDLGFAFVSQRRHRLKERVLLASILHKFDRAFEANTFDGLQVVAARHDAGCKEHFVGEALEVRLALDLAQIIQLDLLAVALVVHLEEANADTESK